MPKLAMPDWATDLGLLVSRAGAGTMMLFAHGWPKLADFAAKADHFPDPLGVGSAASLSLAIFGEFVCAALLVVGFATRAAAVPFLITMLVAALIVHAGDPFSQRELALAYAVPALTLLFTGPGRWSIDHWLASRVFGRGDPQPD